MRILFTGATGFIGRHFILQYPQHSYTILTRSTHRAQRYLPANVEIIRQLSDLDNCNAFDAVINLAGEPIIDRRWTKKQKAVICQSRWQTTQAIVDLIDNSEQPPSVFISGSAIGFYGNTGNSTITEADFRVNNEFAHDVCERWETIALQAQNKTRVVTLRTGIVLGRSGGALEKMLLPFKIGLGGRMGSGHQSMSWIHIGDMVRAIHFILDNETLSGPFNLTAPQPVTNEQMTQALAHTLKTKPRLPVPAVLLSWLMGESATLLLDGQRVIPEKLLNAGFTFEFPDAKTALNDLLQPR